MELPKYVCLNGSEMRLRGDKYWRDGGLWGVRFEIKNGKLLSSHCNQGQDWLHGVELIPITEKEWRKGNGKYAEYREANFKKD